jgi:ABC-type microcin C transport system permease subunit YejE
MMIKSQSPQDVLVEDVAAPRRSRLQDSWRLFKRNRLAFAGLAIFLLFSATAITGFFLTSRIQIGLQLLGIDIKITIISKPVFDPAQVRLQEKLRPPLAKPNLEALSPKEVPTLGVYLFGTDDLGRDVCSRMSLSAYLWGVYQGILDRNIFEGITSFSSSSYMQVSFSLFFGLGPSGLPYSAG